MKIKYLPAGKENFQQVYEIASQELNYGESYHQYIEEIFDGLGKSTIGILAFDGEKLTGFAFAEEGMVLTDDRTDYFDDIQRDIGDEKIWTGAAFAVLEEYRNYKIGSALYLHLMMALSKINVKHFLLEIWIRPDGYMPSNTNLATAGHYTEYGIVKDFYYESSKNGYLCPVCGDECHCSAKIAVVHITV